ncbi:MAG: MltA domain-containing protein [Pseudomonadota bacterium]
MPGLARALALAAGVMAAPVSRAQVLDFADLRGWQADDHQAALQTFVATCDLVEGAEWGPLCALAPQATGSAASARAFFELFFRPVVVGSAPALFTGYYEPELTGSTSRTPRFAYPIYRMPPELSPGSVWYSREEIETRGLLRGRGLEIAWLEDPVEVYFLMVQGSGRIRLQDGSMIRVGYAGKNNQPYKSIGQELVRRGTHSMADVSAREIRSWVRANPAAGAALMNENPSFVFFREIGNLPADRGPIGAMTRSLTAMRSVAVDPAYVPLGAPVWIEKDGPAPLNRLMVAQDTGGAITGEQRADIFFGTGFDAGEAAGQIKDGGRMVILLPIERAYALLPEG